MRDLIAVNDDRLNEVKLPAASRQPAASTRVRGRDGGGVADVRSGSG